MKTGVSPEVTARFMALRRLAGDSDSVDQLPPVDTFRNELRKFYDYREEDKPIVLGALTYLESLISLTAEIMSAAPDSGISILEAFVRDYPGVPGSNLAGRWSNLTESCLALHGVSNSKSVQGMWESSKNIHLNFNEFLNGLLPFIVIGLRQAKGESVNLKIFKASYSEKLDTLSAYTGGLRGRASSLLALSDRRIRNAIAHGDIYFDQAASLIKYGVSEKGKRTGHKMSVQEFMLKAAHYSRIPHAHVAAISAAQLLMLGGQEDRADVVYALEHRRLPR